MSVFPYYDVNFEKLVSPDDTPNRAQLLEIENLLAGYDKDLLEELEITYSIRDVASYARVTFKDPVRSDGSYAFIDNLDGLAKFVKINAIAGTWENKNAIEFSGMASRIDVSYSEGIPKVILTYGDEGSQAGTARFKKLLRGIQELEEDRKAVETKGRTIREIVKQIALELKMAYLLVPSEIGNIRVDRSYPQKADETIHEWLNRLAKDYDIYYRAIHKPTRNLLIFQGVDRGVDGTPLQNYDYFGDRISGTAQVLFFRGGTELNTIKDVATHLRSRYGGYLYKDVFFGGDKISDRRKKEKIILAAFNKDRKAGLSGGLKETTVADNTTILEARLMIPDMEFFPGKRLSIKGIGKTYEIYDWYVFRVTQTWGKGGLATRFAAQNGLEWLRGWRKFGGTLDTQSYRYG